MAMPVRKVDQNWEELNNQQLQAVDAVYAQSSEGDNVIPLFKEVGLIQEDVLKQIKDTLPDAEDIFQRKLEERTDEDSSEKEKKAVFIKVFEEVFGRFLFEDGPENVKKSLIDRLKDKLKNPALSLKGRTELSASLRKLSEIEASNKAKTVTDDKIEKIEKAEVSLESDISDQTTEVGKIRLGIGHFEGIVIPASDKLESLGEQKTKVEELKNTEAKQADELKGFQDSYGATLDSATTTATNLVSKLNEKLPQPSAEIQACDDIKTKINGAKIEFEKPENNNFKWGETLDQAIKPLFKKFDKKAFLKDSPQISREYFLDDLSNLEEHRKNLFNRKALKIIKKIEPKKSQLQTVSSNLELTEKAKEETPKIDENIANNEIAIKKDQTEKGKAEEEMKSIEAQIAKLEATEESDTRNASIEDLNKQRAQIAAQIEGFKENIDKKTAANEKFKKEKKELADKVAKLEKDKATAEKELQTLLGSSEYIEYLKNVKTFLDFLAVFQTNLSEVTNIEPPTSEIKKCEDIKAQIKEAKSAAWPDGDEEPDFSKLEALIEENKLEQLYSDLTNNFLEGSAYSATHFSQYYKPLHNQIGKLRKDYKKLKSTLTKYQATVEERKKAEEELASSKADLLSQLKKIPEELEKLLEIQEGTEKHENIENTINQYCKHYHQLAEDPSVEDIQSFFEKGAPLLAQIDDVLRSNLVLKENSLRRSRDQLADTKKVIARLKEYGTDDLTVDSVLDESFGNIDKHKKDLSELEKRKEKQSKSLDFINDDDEIRNLELSINQYFNLLEIKSPPSKHYGDKNKEDIQKYEKELPEQIDALSIIFSELDTSIVSKNLVDKLTEIKDKLAEIKDNKTELSDNISGKIQETDSEIAKKQALIDDLEQKSSEKLSDPQAAKKIYTTIIKKRFPELSDKEINQMATLSLMNDIDQIQSDNTYREMAERGDSKMLDIIKKKGFKQKIINMQFKVGRKLIQPLKRMKPEELDSPEKIQKLFRNGKVDLDNGFYLLAGIEKFQGKSSYEYIEIRKQLKLLLADKLEVSERLDDAKVNEFLNNALDEQLNKSEGFVQDYFDNYEDNIDKVNQFKISELNNRFELLKADLKSAKISPEKFEAEMQELREEASESGIEGLTKFQQNDTMARYWNSSESQWLKDKGYDLSSYLGRKAKAIAKIGLGMIPGAIGGTAKLLTRGAWETTNLAIKGTIGTAKLPLKALWGTVKRLHYPLMIAAKPLVWGVNLFRANPWQPYSIRETIGGDIKNSFGIKDTLTQTYKGAGDALSSSGKKMGSSFSGNAKSFSRSTKRVARTEWRKEQWKSQKYEDRNKKEINSLRASLRDLKRKSTILPVSTDKLPKINIVELKREIKKLNS